MKNCLSSITISFAAVSSRVEGSDGLFITQWCQVQELFSFKKQLNVMSTGIQPKANDYINGQINFNFTFVTLNIFQVLKKKACVCGPVFIKLNRLTFITSLYNFTILFECFYLFSYISWSLWFIFGPRFDTFPPSIKMKNSNSAAANWLHYLLYIKSSINYSISWKAGACCDAVKGVDGQEGCTSCTLYRFFGLIMKGKKVSCSLSFQSQVTYRVTDQQCSCSLDKRTVIL